MHTLAICACFVCAAEWRSRQSGLFSGEQVLPVLSATSISFRTKWLQSNIITDSTGFWTLLSVAYNIYVPLIILANSYINAQCVGGCVRVCVYVRVFVCTSACIYIVSQCLGFSTLNYVEFVASSWMFSDIYSKFTAHLSPVQPCYVGQGDSLYHSPWSFRLTPPPSLPPSPSTCAYWCHAQVTRGVIASSG